MAYLADSDGIRPDARRYSIVASDDPRVPALVALDALCERVLRRMGRADLLTSLAVTSGITPPCGPDVVAGTTPSSPSLPDAAPTASGSPLALRDGEDCAHVLPSTPVQPAVTPHLPVTVAGIEQRSGDRSTYSAYTQPLTD